MIGHAPLNEEPIGHPLHLPDSDITLYPDLFSPDCCRYWLTVLTQTIGWQQKPITLFGRSLLQPRLTAWYGDAGKSYTYSGLTLPPAEWTAPLLDLKAHSEQVAGVRFNSVLLNLYRDGNDSMGWHSDDEPELGRNPVIASLSFGETRRFQLRHRYDKALRHSLDLTTGSLLIMQGTTQHYWQHQIPKTKRPISPRINLTFRIIHG